MNNDRPAPEATDPPARTVVADDHALVREGFIISMLRGASGLEIVGEANDGNEALELCRRLSPDLVLMDVRMPRMNGLEATRALKAQYPQTSVLIVTSHEDPDYLLEAVRAGAAGYVLKEVSRGQLINAVRRALGGEIPLNQELAMRVLTRLSKDVPKEEDPDLPSGSAGRRPTKEDPSGSAVLPGSLTAREVEVLGLIARGRTNQQIARELLVSTSTIKNHIRHILTKLGVSHRTQAAVRAIEAGLLAEKGEE